MYFRASKLQLISLILIAIITLKFTMGKSFIELDVLLNFSFSTIKKFYCRQWKLNKKDLKIVTVTGWKPAS